MGFIEYFQTVKMLLGYCQIVISGSWPFILENNIFVVFKFQFWWLYSTVGNVTKQTFDWRLIIKIISKFDRIFYKYEK